jgi:hypothetical protein
LIPFSLSQIPSVAGTKRCIVDLNKTASQEVPFPLKNYKNQLKLKMKQNAEERLHDHWIS